MTDHKYVFAKLVLGAQLYASHHHLNFSPDTSIRT